MPLTACVPSPTPPPPPIHSSGCPNNPEDERRVVQPTESYLNVGRSGNPATAIANPESGWLLAVNSTIQQDKEVVDKWQRSMDVLLIFSTLFAAIVTAFLLDMSKELRGQNALLSEMSQTSGGISSVAAARLATRPSTMVRRVNRLWFASLAITIGSTVFAMLTKQWISEYMDGLRIDLKLASEQELLRVARLREYRSAGLRQWHVPGIIGILPILLHVALLLFGAGLVVFFWKLDHGTAIIILVFLCIISFLYVASMLLPLLRRDAPYRTPLSHIFSNIIRTISTPFSPSKREGLITHSALLEAERNEVRKKGEILDRKFLERLEGTTREAIFAELKLETSRLARDSAQQPHLPPNETARSSVARDAEAVGL